MSKENKYNEDGFYERYSSLPRSVSGLNSSWEWQQFREIFPALTGKRVLDLGCGFGWHCNYAVKQGAAAVVGLDISQKMLKRANEINAHKNITYICNSIEDYEYPQNQFDVVVSSLAFHYVESFEDICKNIGRCLADGGFFVFSVEHPSATSADKNAKATHERIFGNYFNEGKRGVFSPPCDMVVKYHRTLSTYFNTLVKSGFKIEQVCEPQASKEDIENGGADESRMYRPVMLMVRAVKV
jgi:SAM-dependent methyltransferase